MKKYLQKLPKLYWSEIVGILILFITMTTAFSLVAQKSATANLIINTDNCQNLLREISHCCISTEYYNIPSHVDNSMYKIQVFDDFQNRKKHVFITFTNDFRIKYFYVDNRNWDNFYPHILTNQVDIAYSIYIEKYERKCSEVIIKYKEGTLNLIEH